MSNAIAKSAAPAAVTKTPVKLTIEQYLTARKPKIAETLPPGIKPERIIQLAIMAARSNADLAACSAESVYMSVVRAAQMGLEPNSAMGQCYLVPFRRKDGPSECTLILGYRGLIDLARRGGELRSIEARVVYANEPFDLRYGIETVLEHRPILDSAKRGPPVAVYMVATLRSGDKHIEAMSKAEVDAIRARSKTGSSGPWASDYDEMARKTVIRRGLKYLPMNPELADRLALDDADPDEQLPTLRREADVVPESKTERLKRELAEKNTPEVDDWAPPLDEAEAVPVAATPVEPAPAKKAAAPAGREVGEEG